MAKPLEDLTNDIVACIQVRDRPLLWGPPGTGKTSLIQSIGRKIGRPVYTIIGSLCDPTDINGFPVVTGETVKDALGRDRPVLRFAPREWMPELNESGGILFLDELTSSAVSVLAALLRSVQDGCFGDYQLDMDRVAIVAAANPPDVAANGQELPATMANRFTHFEFPVGEAAALEWCENFPLYWGNPPAISFDGDRVPEAAMLRARSYVAGFIRRRPNLWFQMPDDTASRGSGGWPSPRSFDRVSWHLGHAVHHNRPPSSILRRAAGAVGPGAGAEFATYVKEASLPDPEEILADPEAYTPTGRPDVDFAVMMSVATAVVHRPEPDRYIAFLKVLGQASKARGDNGPAFEAATVAVRMTRRLVKDPAAPDYIFKKLETAKLAKYVQKMQELSKPFQALYKEMGVAL